MIVAQFESSINLKVKRTANIYLVNAADRRNIASSKFGDKNKTGRQFTNYKYNMRQDTPQIILKSTNQDMKVAKPGEKWRCLNLIAVRKIFVAIVVIVATTLRNTGMNGCRGMSGCRTMDDYRGMNGCRGVNGCRGMGGCRDVNGCRGMGGCESRMNRDLGRCIGS